MSLAKFIGSDRDLEMRQDANGRQFGEVTIEGSEDICISFLKMLAEDMGATLGLDAGNDMRDLYNDICHTDGEPMYLSDGVYLEPDGELIER